LRLEKKSDGRSFPGVGTLTVKTEVIRWELKGGCQKEGNGPLSDLPMIGELFPNFPWNGKCRTGCRVTEEMGEKCIVHCFAKHKVEQRKGKPGRGGRRSALKSRKRDQRGWAPGFADEDRARDFGWF